MSDYRWSVGKTRISRRRFLGGAAAAALGAVGLSAACGEGGEEPAGQTNFDPNGTLRVAIQADRGHLDPQEVGGVSNYYNGGAHFGTLFVPHPVTNNVAPHMATFEWVDNNSALIIRLRDGIVSHDGEPYDAEVLKWSLERVGQRGEYAGRNDWTSGRKNFIDPLGEFRVLDRLTLRVEVARKDVSIPANMTVINMVPRNYIKQVGDREFSLRPVGFGPFRFDSRIPDTETRSTRNDSYFIDSGAEYGPWKPWFKDLIHYVRPEPLSQAAGLEAGEFDVVPDMDLELAKQVEGRRGFNVVWIVAGNGHHVQWNTHVKTDPRTGGPNPFLDKRVRVAANLAVAGTPTFAPCSPAGSLIHTGCRPSPSASPGDR